MDGEERGVDAVEEESIEALEDNVHGGWSAYVLMQKRKRRLFALEPRWSQLLEAVGSVPLWVIDRRSAQWSNECWR